MAPGAVIYAFTCLSPWYICRARPLTPSKLFDLLLTYTVAAAGAGLILSGAAYITAVFIDRAPPPVGPLFGMGLLLYLLSVGFHYAGIAAEASRQAERRAAESRTLAREAELQALRMQLNPHFIFNSLHSIGALATTDGVRARDMCVRLGDFLRTSLRLGNRDSIPLGEELALARNYLEVERVRFGDRLRVAEHIEPGCEECAAPALLLQPLVENAVKHGIAGLIEGGEIRLAARRSDGDVVIELENAFDPEVVANRGAGLGLRHVRRRIEVRYGSEASLEAGPSGGLYKVVLRFPCESPIASSSLV
jgi:LytS/YehU family sensor histidine kinase